jgi:putative SOS response-associated peptidase YedK
VAVRSREDLAREFGAEATGGTGPGDDLSGWDADYNIAPTAAAPVVLERLPRSASGERATDLPPVRRLRLLRWGLVPSWSKGPSSRNRMINARAETLLSRPAFRGAALARRCLVVADGWYEWRGGRGGAGSGRGERKQPFYLRPVGGGPIAFAGVYELWHDRTAPADDPSSWLATYTIVTTAAEPGLDGIHDRMPLVLPADRWDAWLDPLHRAADAVQTLLLPPDAGRFEALPVSPRVNSVAENSPHLIEPVPWEDRH